MCRRASKKAHFLELESNLCSTALKQLLAVSSESISSQSQLKISKISKRQMTKRRPRLRKVGSLAQFKTTKRQLRVQQRFRRKTSR